MSQTPRGHLALTVFMLTAGYYQDSWRKEGSRSEELGYLKLVADLTRMCEDAKLDAVFFGDVVSAKPILQGNAKIEGYYEPVTTLSALAALTTRIGLIGTISTSFSDPFVTARQLSGLDSLSGGRAGWNVVTSWMGNENFGLDEMPLPAERYRRATEFVEVVKKLWDGWSDEAIINDRKTGWWADPEKIRAIDHHGKYFKVKGPLPMRRSPQGHPVIVQAGSSKDGIELGSSIADMIYTAQPDYGKALQFYSDYKQLLATKGRAPEETKILPGILPIVGDSDAEAEELAQDLADHINLDTGRVQLADALKLSLDDLDLSDTIPPERFTDHPSLGSRYYLLKKRAVEDKFTVKEMIVETHRSGAHLWAVGSAKTIADKMIQWYENRACDGFSLNPPWMPDGLRRICTLLVPELRARGYYREEYTGSTLRENLGLPRPGAWDD